MPRKKVRMIQLTVGLHPGKVFRNAYGETTVTEWLEKERERILNPPPGSSKEYCNRLAEIKPADGGISLFVDDRSLKVTSKTLRRL